MVSPSLRILPETVRPADLAGVPLPAGNIDPFGRRIDYMRVSLTDRCNLRCVYCMPAEGVVLGAKDSLLSFEEIWRVVGAARGLGFRKFRVTGGEPLVVRDVLTFVAGLRAVAGDATLGLTTNGVRLRELARPLRQAGIDRLNISLDTLRADRFIALSRRDHLRDVLEGLEAAVHAGFERVKVNVVIVRGVNEDELVPLAKLAATYPIDVRFIEQMPLDGQTDHGFLGASAIVAQLQAALPLEAIVPEDVHAAAQIMFRSSALRGRVGVIAPRSQKFCAQCNRLRLTPSGELKGCLLSEGTLDLRTPLREGVTDAELALLLRYAIALKPLEYKNERYGLDRPMSAIGG